MCVRCIQMHVPAILLILMHGTMAMHSVDKFVLHFCTLLCKLAKNVQYLNAVLVACTRMQGLQN